MKKMLNVVFAFLVSLVFVGVAIASPVGGGSSSLNQNQSGKVIQGQVGNGFNAQGYGMSGSQSYTFKPSGTTAKGDQGTIMGGVQIGGSCFQGQAGAYNNNQSVKVNNGNSYK